MQAIGRCRGVRRDPAEPVAVTILAELALPLTVAEVTQWREAQACRIEVAAAEAALTGRALPLAPGDLVRARPDLWTTKRAAEHDLDRATKGAHSLINTLSPYKRMGPLGGLTVSLRREPPFPDLPDLRHHRAVVLQHPAQPRDGRPHLRRHRQLHAHPAQRRLPRRDRWLSWRGCTLMSAHRSTA